MPHHSGGGSHHHGSHGGHRSSGSRSHRSGSSSGPRVSRRPYRGSRRYRYRTRHGYRYVYSSGVPKAPSVLEFITTLIVMLPFIGMVLYVCGEMFVPKTPTKLKTSPPSVNSMLADNAGVITNRSELIASMNDFYSLTGISPSVVTLNNEDWSGSGKSLADVAYDMYLQKFSDEDHFLVVYSEPSSKYDDNWCWDAIQGDNTDYIITSSHFGRFQSDLQRSLEENMGAGEALKYSFDNSLSYMMEKKSPLGSSGESFSIIFMFLMFMLFMIIPVFSRFTALGRKYEEAPDGIENMTPQNLLGMQPQGTYMGQSQGTYTGQPQGSYMGQSQGAYTNGQSGSYMGQSQGTYATPQPQGNYTGQRSGTYGAPQSQTMDDAGPADLYGFGNYQGPDIK